MWCVLAFNRDPRTRTQNQNPKSSSELCALAMPAGERNSRLWSWGWARGAPVPLAPQSECYIMWRTFCIAAAFASAEPWIVCVSELFWEGDRVNRGKRKEGRKEVKAETCCDCPRSKAQCRHLFGPTAQVFKVCVWLGGAVPDRCAAGWNSQTVLLLLGGSRLRAYHTLALQKQTIIFFNK